VHTTQSDPTNIGYANAPKNSRTHAFPELKVSYFLTRKEQSFKKVS